MTKHDNYTARNKISHLVINAIFLAVLKDFETCNVAKTITYTNTHTHKAHLKPDFMKIHSEKVP